MQAESKARQIPIQIFLIENAEKNVLSYEIEFKLISNDSEYLRKFLFLLSMLLTKWSNENQSLENKF